MSYITIHYIIIHLLKSCFTAKIIISL